MVENTTYPRLVLLPTAEELCKFRLASLCTEGEKLCDIPPNSLETALLVLYASYYVFNTSYPNKWKDVFTFIDCALLGIKEGVLKRIGLQKFFTELERV